VAMLTRDYEDPIGYTEQNTAHSYWLSAMLNKIIPLSIAEILLKVA